MKWQYLVERLICRFFCGADKNVLYKILYHQKLLVLKEHVYMGIALLGETLKDVSRLLLCIERCIGRTGQKHSGCTDNCKIPCGVFCWKMWMSFTSKLVRCGQLWMRSRVTAASVTWCPSHAGARGRSDEQRCSFAQRRVNSLCSISRK